MSDVIRGARAKVNDRRTDVFRTATFALIESLDAVAQLARWSGAEAPPKPLRDAAALVVDRLAAANRLASGKFSGNVADAVRVTTLCAAMMRLDAAYVAYRKGAPSSPEAATAALELALGAASTDLAP